MEREQKAVASGERKKGFEYSWGGIEGLDLVKKKGYIYFTLSDDNFGRRSCLNFIEN